MAHWHAPALREQLQLQHHDDDQSDTSNQGDTSDQSGSYDQGESSEQETEADGASRQGWIVYCPEEDSQLGDPFASSDDAQHAASYHNQQTHHNAHISPIYNY